MDSLRRIAILPDVCGGEPTTRRMRIAVKTILEYLSAGETVENILDAHPVLEPEDIQVALAYVIRQQLD